MATKSENDAHTHTRHAAMLSRNPIRTFLFDNTGKLLVANEAASFQSNAGLSSPNDVVNDLRALFRLGLYAGGKAEADAAYEEAMHAVFHLEVDQHCHVQYQEIPEDGDQLTPHWDQIEMWPLQDPVTKRPAVMVKKRSITRQKKLELQLDQQQLALQRRNQELEEHSVTMREQQLQLETEAQAMAQRLHAVVQDKFQPATSHFDADTPIDKALSFLQSCIKGHMPPVTSAMHVYHLLSQSGTSLHMPVGLEHQLLDVKDMDTEDNDVGRSMYQLLQGNTLSTPVHPGIWKKGPDGAPGTAAPLEWEPSGPTSVPPSLTPSVERMLKEAEDSWQFDIFDFARETPGHTLSLLALYLHKQTGFIADFRLNEGNLCNYMQKIESGYLADNPYHNSVHAASVLQLTHMIIRHGGITDAVMKPALKLGTYWSAIVHDHEHGGLNNDYLIKTASPISVLYNDQSPLENHHCASAVKQLFDPRHNYLPADADSPFDHQQVRQCSISQVLGTDMKKHFDITSRFQAAFGKLSGHSAIDWSGVKPEDKTLVYQMVLKCADIGHLATHPRTHRRWAYQLEEEFFRQGDQERNMGLPISPLMDRSLKGGMTRSQLGFYNIVGIPMFKAMADLFKGTQPLLDGAMANYRYWEAGTATKDLP